MSAKSKLPKSKAKTAYGLLSEVRAMILEEPRRLDMDRWRVHIGDSDSMPPILGFPACGTVACIGGWCEVLKGKKSGSANILLGIDESQADSLFYPGALLRDADGYSQTPHHAERAARHIARFQKKYAAQLKAKRV